MPRVKICGITRLEDAELAVKLGAHAVGFIFWPRSPRAITRDRARSIAAALPPFVTRVGVFVNTPAADVIDTVQVAGLDVVQLHGDEDLSAYASVGVRLVRSVTLADDEAVERVSLLPSSVTPLVDAADDVQRGGTGRRADWRLAARLADRRPMILAGGLTPDNVAEAVRAVRPWGVDVSSGIEHSPGIKSRERMQAFFAALTARTEEP